jgi:ankyrin repeat protein
VVAERVESGTAPYVGYFAGATLLHHVAGNPIRGPLPPNIVDVARTLIEAGADVMSLCGDVPRNYGGTVMALVASGAPMAESGLYRPMIDLLIASGYRFEDEPRLLAACLYHTVECQRQREVGEYLAAKGAKVDLVFAAALGRTDLVARLIAQDGRGAEALVWAAMNGRDATVSQLLDMGADVNGRAHVSGADITPLHGAAWAGWDSTARLLLERGADITQRDTEHGGTPVGWAAYCRKQNVVELFRTACAGRLSLIDSIAVGDVAAVEAALQGQDVNAERSDVPGNPGVLLRWAVNYGQPDVVRLLLARGADRTLANQEGKTAYDFARERRDQELMDLLRPAGDQGS